jgi:thiamine kinase-like enzyme
MDFVPTVRLTAQMLEHERHGKEIYRDLALRLRTLHNSSSFTESPTNIFRDVEKTAKAGEASLMPALAFDVLQNILKLESIVKKHQKNVPSHKDLTSNNVLYDGTRTYFIDWEMAADTDQFFDVAVVAIFHIFNESQEDDYLKSYCNTEPTPVQKAYFYVMKQLALAFWAFKHLRRVTVGQGKLDLSKEDVMAMQSLPPFKDFMLKTFNGCSKVFTYEDLKIASYMFLREAVRNMNSSDYEKAIQLLSK